MSRGENTNQSTERLARHSAARRSGERQAGGQLGRVARAATLMVVAVAAPGACLAVGACNKRDAPGAHAAVAEIILATTTSTQDSGLLSVLVPKFEQATGIRVKVIAVGTGEALGMGARGDADVLLVHSRAAEDEFMSQGNGELRLDVMHNDFLLIGPAADPAGAKGKSLVAALDRIAETSSPFVSRADKSGTHKKEEELWKKASINPEGKSWLVRTGQGMGETARIASEKQAYTLIDRATYLALKSSLSLVAVTEGDPALRNPYGVIVVSRQKHPKLHAIEATTFARWLVSAEAQKLIADFGVDRFGERVFVPDAVPTPSATAAPAAAPAPS